MESREQQEKKNKQKATIVSLSIHVLLVLLFAFMLAWKEPYPPLPEYGIEINFGEDQVGSGDVQPDRPATSLEKEAEPDPQTSAEKSSSQESSEQESEILDELEAIETSPSKVESPVEAEKPKSKEKAENKPKEKPAETQKEAKKEEVKEPKPEVKKEALYPGGGGSPSQGDNKDKIGDKGDPKGSKDEKNLYGTRGGGDGASLDMSGWQWDAPPRVTDRSEESGRIVFEVKIDDRGNIVSIKTLERGVSPGVEKFYRQAIEELTFSPTGSNTRPAAFSTGRITFIIRSR